MRKYFLVVFVHLGQPVCAPDDPNGETRSGRLWGRPNREIDPVESVAAVENPLPRQLRRYPEDLYARNATRAESVYPARVQPPVESPDPPLVVRESSVKSCT